MSAAKGAGIGERRASYFTPQIVLVWLMFSVRRERVTTSTRVFEVAALAGEYAREPNVKYR